jgi:hypothetical protein
MRTAPLFNTLFEFADVAGVDGWPTWRDAPASYSSVVKFMSSYS